MSSTLDYDYARAPVSKYICEYHPMMQLYNYPVCGIGKRVVNSVRPLAGNSEVGQLHTITKNFLIILFLCQEERPVRGALEAQGFQQIFERTWPAHGRGVNSPYILLCNFIVCLQRFLSIQYRIVYTVQYASLLYYTEAEFMNIQFRCGLAA